MKAGSPKGWKDWSSGEVGAKKYNPEGVQSMQCSAKELCSASAMRYGDNAGRCTARRRIVMPGAVDDGGGGRGFKSYTTRRQGRVTQDTTTWQLAGWW